MRLSSANIRGRHSEDGGPQSVPHRHAHPAARSSERAKNGVAHMVPLSPVATGLQRLGVALEVTEAVLNHVSGSRAGIVGVYQRHNYFDEKKAALAAWARELK